MDRQETSAIIWLQAIGCNAIWENNRTVAVNPALNQERVFELLFQYWVKNTIKSIRFHHNNVFFTQLETLLSGHTLGFRFSESNDQAEPGLSNMNKTKGLWIFHHIKCLYSIYKIWEDVSSRCTRDRFERRGNEFSVKKIGAKTKEIRKSVRKQISPRKLAEKDLL